MTTSRIPSEAAITAVEREIDDLIREVLTRPQPASVDAIIAELLQRHSKITGPDAEWARFHVGEVVRSRIAVVIGTLRREHDPDTTAEELRARGRDALAHAAELDRYRQQRAATRKKAGGKES